MAEATYPPQPTLTDRDAAWMDGYRAALADAIEVVDALGGPSFANLSAPVLLRMKTRLIELQGQAQAA